MVSCRSAPGRLHRHRVRPKADRALVWRVADSRSVDQHFSGLTRRDGDRCLRSQIDGRRFCRFHLDRARLVVSQLAILKAQPVSSRREHRPSSLVDERPDRLR